MNILFFRCSCVDVVLKSFEEFVFLGPSEKAIAGFLFGNVLDAVVSALFMWYGLGLEFCCFSDFDGGLGSLVYDGFWAFE